MKKNILKYTVLSITSIIAFLFIMTLIDLILSIDELNYKATAILPTIELVFLISGIISLNFITFAYSKGSSVKKYIIISLLLFGASALFLGLSKTINPLISAQQKEEENRFGNVELSDEEIKEYAKALTTSDLTIALDNYNQENEETLNKRVEAKASILKLEIMLNGLKTNEELPSKDIELFMTIFNDCETKIRIYIHQKKISMETVFSVNNNDGKLDNLKEFSMEYISRAEKLLKPTTEYLEIVNSAFTDSALSEEEKQELINIKDTFKQISEHLSKLK